MPERPNWPCEFVAATYFFPVKVFEALTVTPGSGVLPLRADPVISNVAGAGGVGIPAGAAGGGAVAGGDTGGAGGGVSCAREWQGNKIAVKPKMNIPRRMDFNF